MTDAHFRQATELRPRRVGEIIDAAMQIYGRYWKFLFTLSATILLPFQVLSALAQVSVDPTLEETLQAWQLAFQENTAARPKFTGEQFAAIGVTGFLTIVSTFVLTAALTKIVTDVFLRQNPNRGVALKAALRRGPAMFVNSMLVGLISALGLIAVGTAAGILAVVVENETAAIMVALIGGVLALALMVFAYVRLSVGGPSIVAEGVGPFRALRRSNTLAAGRFWPILGALVLSVLITAIPASILSTVITSLLRFAGGNNDGFDFVWSAIGGTVASALTTPIASAIAVILYFDLRVRREGFDLEELGARTPDGSLPPPPTTSPTTLL